MPDFPATQGDDPMCVDDVWMGFMNALTKKVAPQVAREGIGDVADDDRDVVPPLDVRLDAVEDLLEAFLGRVWHWRG